MGGIGSILEIIDYAASVAAALALGVWGIELAEQYEDIARDALQKSNDIAERIFAIESEITDHWMTVQYPQHAFVLNYTYDYNAPTENYQRCVDVAVEYGRDLGHEALNGMFLSQDRYRFCVRAGCNRELQAYSAASQVDFAQQLMRHQERRNERQTQMGIEYSARAYRATREAPDDIFALMRNAQSIYGNLYNVAAQSMDGLAGLIGAGMGAFIGGFFTSGAG